MKTIRLNVFETNSSSCHSLILCSDSEYQLLKAGKLYIDKWLDKLVTASEVYSKYIADLKRDNKNPEFLNKTEAEFVKVLDDIKHERTSKDTEFADSVASFLNYNSEYQTYYEYGTGFETFCNSKKIGNSDVVAFGYYGYDG